MNDSRFEVPAHSYRLVTFTELPPRIIGPDNCCTCTCADYCPAGRTGSQPRCTLEELKRLNQEARFRHAWQSGF
jgi:hypothetical protein